MKKLLLISLLSIVLFACNKKKDDPQPDNSKQTMLVPEFYSESDSLHSAGGHLGTTIENSVNSDWKLRAEGQIVDSSRILILEYQNHPIDTIQLYPNVNFTYNGRTYDIPNDKEYKGLGFINNEIYRDGDSYGTVSKTEQPSHPRTGDESWIPGYTIGNHFSEIRILRSKNKYTMYDHNAPAPNLYRITVQKTGIMNNAGITENVLLMHLLLTAYTFR